MKKLFSAALLDTLLSISFACKRDTQWQIKGEIKDAPGELLCLEASHNGNWYTLDSLRLGKDGKFNFKQPAAQNPGIFRLTLNGRSAYFPIDSADNMTFVANAAAFDNDYVISGTQGAEDFTTVNRILAAAGNAAATDTALKRNLSNIILSNPSGNAAYYIINRRLPNGSPLFDPNKKEDRRIIGAVANAFNEKRPTDPRTDYLKNLYISSQRNNATDGLSMHDTLTVNELNFIDIDLLNENGKPEKLSSTVEKGPTLLNFTVYTADFSPALNLELGKIYEKYAPKGLQIYQVGFDSDEFQWRQSAKNIPWTTVFNSPKDGGKYLQYYNVTTLPVTFLIDKNGELVERITDPTEIEAAVKRYM